jgi:hypothetical protein
MKYYDLKVGDKLIVDGGFSCMTQGNEKEIFDDNGELYVKCTYGKGKHYLYAQKDVNDNLYGFKIVK